MSGGQRLFAEKSSGGGDYLARPLMATSDDLCLNREARLLQPTYVRGKYICGIPLIVCAAADQHG